MKEILFLLLVSIIATQKKAAANPLLEGLLGDDRKIKVYTDACKAASDAINSYYKDQRNMINQLLGDNPDTSVLETLLDALDSTIKKLKADITGDPKNFIKGSANTLKTLEDNLKDLFREINKLSEDFPQLKDNLKKVTVLLLKIQTKCKEVITAHGKVCVEFLKSPGLVAALLEILANA